MKAVEKSDAGEDAPSLEGVVERKTREGRNAFGRKDGQDALLKDLVGLEGGHLRAACRLVVFMGEEKVVLGEEQGEEEGGEEGEKAALPRGGSGHGLRATRRN